MGGFYLSATSPAILVIPSQTLSLIVPLHLATSASIVNLN